MSWAVWLAVPVALTLLAALVSWWRGRPERELDTVSSMQAHTDYLDALGRTARSRDRGLGRPSSGADSADGPVEDGG